MTRAILITLFLATATRVAYAGDDKAAEALIAKGLELRLAGKSLEAVEMFQKANDISPTPRSAGQLGLAESAVERWEDAEQHINTSLASPHDPWVKNHHAVLEQALTLVGTHIGQIALTGPAGAAIVISGKSAGTLPLAKPIRVNAGPAFVTATASGYKQYEMSVPVEAGKETQLKIVLDPIPPPLAPAPATTAATPAVSPLRAKEVQAQSSWRTWAGGGLIGIGAGVAAWGIVWIAINNQNASGSCSSGAPTDCTPVYNTKTAGYVLTGVGVAAAAAGGFLLYTGRSRSGDVSVAAGPSSLFLTGRF